MAVTDIRLNVEFFTHPKTVKLERRCGVEGLKALMVLWTWAARNRPTGDLSGMTDEDIEIAADWRGEPDSLLKALLGLGWVDGEQNSYSLHEWAHHNPWAAGADSRADKARLSRMAATYPEIYLAVRATGAIGITNDEYRRRVREYESNEPLTFDNDSLTPSPSPSPSPSPEERRPAAVDNSVHNFLHNAPMEFPEIISCLPGYKPERNEGLWVAILERDFPEIDLREEVMKAKAWAEKKRVRVKDFRGFFRKWLEKNCR